MADIGWMILNSKLFASLTKMWILVKKEGHRGISLDEQISSGSESTSTLGWGIEVTRAISPFSPAFPNLKTFYSASRMWESDDLRESKWQGDTAELEWWRQGVDEEWR